MTGVSGSRRGGRLATVWAAPALVVLAGCGTLHPGSARAGVGAGPAVGTGVGDADPVRPLPAPGSCHTTFVGPYPLPDPVCTPGATDPRVTQGDIGTTICRAGWTAGVRPPERVTRPEKAASAAAYGYTGPFATAEYDHLVPLELGGAPDDSANLWLEPNDRPGATSFRNTKDGLESVLHDLVCSGRLALSTAQEAIASDWVRALGRFAPPEAPSTVPAAPGPPTGAPPAHNSVGSHNSVG